MEAALGEQMEEMLTQEQQVCDQLVSCHHRLTADFLVRPHRPFSLLALPAWLCRRWRGCGRATRLLRPARLRRHCRGGAGATRLGTATLAAG